MKAIEIPIASSVPHFVQENAIFEERFFLEFEWIEREAFWMLHIGDSFDKALASGMRLQADWPLYTHYGVSMPFRLFLHAKTRASLLSLNSLSQNFFLVAYEAL